jgi:hypothetical protein
VKQLMKEEELLLVVRIKSRLLRDLRARRLIPFFKINSKTILYDPARVLAALEKYERTEAGVAK